MGFKLENMLLGKIAGERERKRERKEGKNFHQQFHQNVVYLVNEDLELPFHTFRRFLLIFENFLNQQAALSRGRNRLRLKKNYHVPRLPRKCSALPGSPGMTVIMLQSAGG